MPTFTNESVNMATVVLLARLIEALNASGALPEAQSAVAIKAAITQLNGTDNADAAAVLTHFFQSWLARNP